MRWRTAIPLTLAAAGLGAVAYGSLIERTRWTLRRYDVPVLAPDSEPLRLLHLSDLHMLPGQRSKQSWIHGLAALDPDFVALTGDNLASADAVPAMLDALAPLLTFPGGFVFGSNDYYGPVWKNPLEYFDTDHRRRLGEPLPWRELRAAFVDAGWVDLTNQQQSIVAGGRVLSLAGVDDPHLGLDDYDAIAGWGQSPRHLQGETPESSDADLRVGMLHSPEPALLDRFAQDGSDLILAGHTHGGQICIPYFGALVTNCGITRGHARGLHRWMGNTWLHVSAGLGTSPYFPMRFACPPEASMLTLVGSTQRSAAVG